MRVETTLPNPIPGAGRIVDAVWPSPSQFIGSAPIATRNSFAATAVSVIFTAFGGGAANSVAMWKGVPIISINCSAVAGNGNAVGLLPAKVLMATTKSALNGLYNDFQCWRVMWTAATFVAPGATGEVGMYLCTDQNTTKIVTTPGSGFGFRFLSDGSIVFLTITGGVPTNTTLRTVAQGYDCTDIHTYELRLFSATATADASLQVLIDNQSFTSLLPATSRSWAAGSLLPPMQLVGGAVGFIPTAVAMANVASGLFINQMRVIAGPTLDSLF